jgi:hypothetical protein
MTSNNFVLTAEAHSQALPNFHFSTQAVHADDFVSPHRAIAPAMHSAVNYRYARNPDDLVEMENDDVLTLLTLTQRITDIDSQMLHSIHTFTLATQLPTTAD